MNEFSIIIPVCNEADNVEKLVNEIVAALPENQFRYEIIYVDDGSTDDTVSRVRTLAKTITSLSIISHKQNYGQSAALLTGVKAARFALIVTLDGDGQNDPADIPRLFGYLTDDKTVVFGNRKKRDDHVIRRFSSRVGNGVRQSLLKDDCVDTGCSLKLFPRQPFLMLPHFNHLHRFLPALFKRAGFKLINVAVNHRPRWHGKSKYGVMNRLFVGIHDLFGVHWLLKRPCEAEVKAHEH